MEVESSWPGGEASLLFVGNFGRQQREVGRRAGRDAAVRHTYFQDQGVGIHLN